MNIDLTRLLNSYVDEVNFENIIEFDEEYLKNTDIRKISAIEICGSIKKTMDEVYSLYINVVGNMVLPCSISLEDVNIPININVSEILTDNPDLDEEYLKINGKSIDIKPIIWQNILMEIPIKVIKEGLNRNNFNGNGWKLLTEEDINNNKEAE